MSRSRAFTRHQRNRAIARTRRMCARWGYRPAESAIKRMSGQRAVCSCILCRPGKHVGGNGFRRWEGVRQMMRAEKDAR